MTVPPSALPHALTMRDLRATDGHDRDHPDRGENRQYPNWRDAGRSCALIKQRRSQPSRPRRERTGLFHFLPAPSDGTVNGEFMP
jgi:hypothetical protein